MTSLNINMYRQYQGEKRYAAVKDRRERQVTIPKKIRDALGIQPGDTVCYLVGQDGVIIKKMGGIKDIKGMVEYDGPTVSIEDMDDAVLEYAERKA